VPNLKYYLVGKYDVDEFERLSKIINDLQLESKVDIVGYVSDERLQSLYLNSDLFIMPSTKEGFGIVFIEAMLHGLPVIAGNQDGSVDALSNGELGQLINPHHKNELVDSIQNVYKLKMLNQLNPFQIQDKALRKFNFNVFSNRIVTEIDFIK
jgi:glycosyltransferase involved in cell wall biosynthesis